MISAIIAAFLTIVSPATVSEPAPAVRGPQVQTQAYPRAPLGEIPLGGGRTYSYAPSSLVLDDGEEIHYSCAGDRRVVDVILATSAFGDERVVFERDRNGWDSGHVCDPSVVFDPVGEQWLMAYTGASSEFAPFGNRIGFAVSDSPWGPFERLGGAYGAEPIKGVWGSGQPSLVVHEGVVKMFYTYGNPYSGELNVRWVEFGNWSTDSLVWSGINGIDVAIDPDGGWVRAIPARATGNDIIARSATLSHDGHGDRVITVPGWSHSFDPGLRRDKFGVFMDGMTVSVSQGGDLHTYRLHTIAV